MAADSKRVEQVGRAITMMQLAEKVAIERKGSYQANGKRCVRFIVTIDVEPSKLSGNKNNSYPGDLYQSNSISDQRAAEQSIKRVAQLVGREAYKASGREPPPLTKDERDQLHQELKNEGIVQTAPRRATSRKKTAKGRDACPKCGKALEDGICKTCARELLERDDEDLFDVG